ncbi:MAG: DUF2163 domain-containing protein [Hyphomicrobiales bacterium]|nr:DUF2163 domain-containing protein [Hyphomicrobiales bacterium]
MRAISPVFAAALAGEATTLCHCWRIARRDGFVMGFTDHDEDIAFGGVTFAAAAGLDAAQAEAQVGLGVGSGDVAGAFDSAGLTESDLAAGRYDGASVEIWLVDWSNVAARTLLDAANIGEVKRSEFAFVAELRSLAHKFDQQRGRQFQRGCAADCGDARCGLDLTAPAWSTQATILAQESAAAFVVAPDQGFSPGFFTGGALRNGAEAHAIKLHERGVAGERIVLWSPATFAAATRVTLQAGCDKSPESCATKFNNIVNFRGFPHMPSADIVTATPRAQQSAMDGGSFFT